MTAARPWQARGASDVSTIQWGIGPLWLLRIRGTRVRFRRKGQSNGPYFQGRQQARNVPNGETLRSLGEIPVPALNWAGNRDVNKANSLSSNNWRTSPVPAPAVIPAPVMYLEVAAVKTLVVEAGLWEGSWGRGRPCAAPALTRPCALAAPCIQTWGD